MTLSTSKRVGLLLVAVMLGLALLSACGRVDTKQNTGDAPSDGGRSQAVPTTVTESPADSTRGAASNDAASSDIASQPRSQPDAATDAPSQLARSSATSSQTSIPLTPAREGTPAPAPPSVSPLPHAPVSQPIAGCGAASHPPTGCPPA